MIPKTININFKVNIALIPPFSAEKFRDLEEYVVKDEDVSFSLGYNDENALMNETIEPLDIEIKGKLAKLLID